MVRFWRSELARSTNKVAFSLVSSSFSLLSRASWRLDFSSSSRAPPSSSSRCACCRSRAPIVSLRAFLSRFKSWISDSNRARDFSLSSSVQSRVAVCPLRSAATCSVLISSCLMSDFSSSTSCFNWSKWTIFSSRWAIVRQSSTLSAARPSLTVLILASWSRDVASSLRNRFTSSSDSAWAASERWRASEVSSRSCSATSRSSSDFFSCSLITTSSSRSELPLASRSSMFRFRRFSSSSRRLSAAESSSRSSTVLSLACCASESDWRKRSSSKCWVSTVPWSWFLVRLSPSFSAETVSREAWLRSISRWASFFSLIVSSSFFFVREIACSSSWIWFSAVAYFCLNEVPASWEASNLAFSSWTWSWRFWSEPATAS